MTGVFKDQPFAVRVDRATKHITTMRGVRQTHHGHHARIYFDGYRDPTWCGHFHQKEAAARRCGELFARKTAAKIEKIPDPLPARLPTRFTRDWLDAASGEFFAEDDVVVLSEDERHISLIASRAALQDLAERASCHVEETLDPEYFGLVHSARRTLFQLDKQLGIRPRPI